MTFRPYQLTTLVIGAVIAGMIFYMVRRDKVHIRHTFWWVAVGAGSLVLGAFPRISDRIADTLGIGYPPILLLTVGLGMALIKILTVDLEISNLERKVRRLSQRLAILDGEDRPREKEK